MIERRLRDLFKKKIKGSIVLEASYIFPFTIISIFAVMFFAYYKHDGLVLRSGLKRNLIRAVSEDREENSEAYTLERLYYMRCRDLVFQKNGKVGRMKAEVSFPRFMNFDFGMHYGEVVEEYRYHKPQNDVRKLALLLDVP